ncbi:MAG: S49 family peptidase [Bradyrhizobium sp.]|uniref:S49 family peptidase n=1 Tax=Bradyrhizobium sp. TaxID=376 RepID=UPI003BF209F8
MSSTSITFEHLKAQLFNRPLLVDADRIAVMIDVLADRTGIAFDPAEIERANGRIDRLPAGARTAMRGPARPRSPNSGDKLYPVEGETAMIPVHGTLVNRGAWIGPYSGLTSYEGLRRQFREAAADEDVNSVILDVDSAGGQASGAFEIAAVVRDLRALKPVVAVVNDMAASAAYALASAATRVIITPSGVAGSIGVVLAHFDHSARLDKAGVRPTLIHAGARKVDANPFQPLPAGVQKNLQADVDKFYEMFVETVALNRPSLSPAAIKATEAATFIGRAAIDAGLADQIGGMEEALLHVRTVASPKVPLQHGLDGVRPGSEKISPPQLSPFDAAVAAAHAAVAQKAAADAAERARQKALTESWERVVDDLARRTRGS